MVVVGHVGVFAVVSFTRWRCCFGCRCWCLLLQLVIVDVVVVVVVVVRFMFVCGVMAEVVVVVSTLSLLYEL